MKKPITKPKQRTSAKMIKKKGNGVVATSEKKGAAAEKSGTASAQKNKIIDTRLSPKDFATLKKFKTENLQLARELKQKNREIHIEAALERVRIRTMAMHKSEELREVVHVFFQQLHPFGFAKWGFQLRIAREDNSGFYSWLSTPAQRVLPERYNIPTLDHWALKKYWSIYKKQVAFDTIELKGRDKLKLDRLIFDKSDLRNLPAAVKKNILSHDYVLFSVASMKYGLLEAIDVEPIKKEEVDILKRFAKVFEQTYTRFLDLQKAEAQAREAQIEASMERVRSRTMAMHKSDELGEVSVLLYRELMTLGVTDFHSCGYVEVDEVNKIQHTWMTMPDGTSLGEGTIPLTGDPVLNERYKSWKNKEEIFHQIVLKKQLAKHIQFVIPSFNNDREEEVVLGFPAPCIFYCSHFSFGYLHIITGKKMVSTNESLLVRFTRVFEMTYKRFLDLQKAEEQAREAQIEAALERIRARTMAMQKPDELLEVGGLLYKELSNLGVSSLTSGYTLVDKDGKIDWNYVASPEDGSIAPKPLGAPRDETKVMRSMTTSWEKQEPFHVIELNPQETIKHQTYIAENLINFPITAKELISATPERLVLQTFNFEQGYLLIVGAEKLSDENVKMIVRFARVFEMTYRRFLDLQKAETQAREAQIEAALERVRSRSMAMHRSDELSDVVLVLYQQMETLGFAKGGCELILCNEKSGLLEYWHTNPIQSSVPGCYCVSPEVHDFFKKVWKAWKQQAPRLVIEMKDQEKRKLDIALLEKTDFKRIDKKTKNWILKEKVAVFSHVTMKFGLLEAIDSVPISVEQLSILQRFAKVFEQTYTRFLDLQKAEAQAREAEIQLALERVRARTMAMQKSDELREVVGELFHQVQSLGIEIQMFVIFIFKPDGAMEWWGTEFSEKGLPQSYYIPSLEEFTNHSRARNLIEIRRNKTPYQVFELSGKEKKNWDQFLLEKTGLEQLPAYIKKGMRSLDKIVLCDSVCEHGILEVAGQVALSGEHENILQRFSKVFEQTYTRFLDVQKAEIQAREAQIEAALERVRSRTMGMQRSDELQEAALLLFQQVIGLGVPAFGSGFNIWDEDRKFSTAWMAGQDRLQPPFKTSSSEDIFLRIYDSAQRGEALFVEEQGGEALKVHYDYMNSIPVFKDIADKMAAVGQSFPTFQIMHCAFFSQGYLMFITFESVPNAYDIFRRFAKVFEQTYTRFLDLQKAEAQAREAQIEAALERVRARTMAMYQSEELSDCAELLFSELSKLGGSLWSSGFAILQDDEQGESEYRTTDQEGIREEVTFIPNKWDSTMEYLYEGWKQNDQYRSYDLGGEEIRQHYANMLALPKSGHVFQVVLDAGSKFPEWQQMHAAYFKLGYLLVISLDHYRYPELLVRFARVFEQTYTRFLDLQKAEAQAKEAQIEASLERIRSRTMGMQKTDELKEIVALLYEECNKFGFASVLVILNTRRDEDDGFNWWFSANEQTILPQSYFIPDIDEPVLLDIKSIWESGKPGGYIQMGGNVKVEHDRRLFSETGLRELPNQLKEMMRSYESVFLSIANMKNGFIEVAANASISEEQANILQRYAKVFEQTYTRFVDLQKAEAQAREAQIEAGLERVRARAMGMQTSEELNQLIGTVFTELTKLDLVLTRCLIMIFDPTTNDSRWWMANSEAPNDPMNFLIRYHEYAPYLAYLDAWRNRTLKWQYELKGKEKIEWDDFIFTETELSRLPEFVIAGMRAPEWVFLNSSFNNFGNLTLASLEPLPDEHFEIMLRFARVFDLTYTRFNDLKQAETQAREAQIEVALERVRSRSMAMQKSTELKDVVHTLSNEIGKLDVIFNRTFICIFEPATMGATWWMSNPESGEAFGLFIKYHEHLPYLQHVKAWRNREATWQYILEGTDKKEWDTFLFTETDLSLLPDSIKESMQSQTQVYLSCSFSNFGYLALESSASISDAQFDILSRFSKTFNQSYTRFLDIQKAEAQAREAQIEIALERIRARALAMHSSTELTDVANVLRQQMGLLGQAELEVSAIHLYAKDADTFDSWWAFRPGIKSEGQIVSGTSKFRIKTSELAQEWVALFQSDKTEYTTFASGEKLKEWLDEVAANANEITNYWGGSVPTEQYFHNSDFTGGSLVMVSLQPPSEESKNLQKRAASVFDLAYRRYLDLQKAEAQAREALIEVALERVRAASMAMHKSEELPQVALVLLEQLEHLGITDLDCSINIVDPATKDFISYSASSIKESADKEFHQFPKLNLNNFGFLRKAVEMTDAGHTHFSLQLKDELYREIMNVWDTYGYPGFRNKNDFDEVGVVYLHVAHFNRYSGISISSLNELSEEKMSVLNRMAKTFGMSYTRFLDLQKAEAQAREARIEAALERIRSRTMAMHKSDELSEVASLLFQQIGEMGIKVWTAGFNVWLNNDNAYQDWITSPKGGFIEPYIVDTTQFPVFIEVREAKQRGDDFFVQYVGGEMIKAMYGELSKFAPQQFEIMLQDGFEFPKHQYDHFVFGSTVSLMFITFEPLPEAHDIFKRFGKVFEQTYTRFLDLQKAEAQAREAQVETALERVRSRSMAMHKSDELLDVVNTVFERLRGLNLPIDAAAIFVFEKGGYEYWFATADSKYPTGMHLPTRGNQVVDDISNARETQVNFFSKLYSFDDKNHFFHNIFENTDFRHIPDERKKFLLECESLSLSVALEKNSGIQLNSYTGKVLSSNEVDVLKRFTRVFEQAYTRFLDLQRAEAQAREAQIEAALERVRSRSMAMQHSGELNEVLTTMFAELSSLGLALARCVIWTFNIEDRSARWWAANPEEESGTESFLIPYTDHPTCNEYWKSWEERRARYFYELSGETKRTWDDYLFNHTDMARLPEPVKTGMKAPEKVLLYNSFRDFGVLFAVSLEPLNEENFDIIERFGKVFDQSYTRFNDIKQAETREKEAIRQASLDRVRAEIASMRTTQDLERITPLIWKELTTLNVPFIRCGVFIMDEPLQQIHTFLSTPDGKAIAAFHLPYDDPGRTSEILTSWNNKQVYIEHWDETAFSELGNLLVEQGAVPSKDAYLKTIPQGGIHLHCLPFMQGMLYVGNTIKLKEDDIQLTQSVAGAFATAYARYEDFNKLEAAKQQVDKALVDLKQAQQQLVQSEKMASLGELTAGIAHEIQNPLNFVNNFSEVNEELLAEMKDELRNGKIDDALALADNVLENQKKINHHGKRADGIVKGMLQHSRSSSGIKEPTDINVLADEYLRLAYHGFRAKDKSFNAKFITDFDPTIEAINIIPQEIGRVILNLINNAFYAVTEKKKSLDLTGFKNLSGLEDMPAGAAGLPTSQVGYEATVTVTTKKSNDKVLISVKDNGNGIPQTALDKIFQPFFTTKPTGQGTGLGLSLSYDIVTKGHGGTIQVSSTPDSGTEFTIHLPLKS